MNRWSKDICSRQQQNWFAIENYLTDTKWCLIATTLATASNWTQLSLSVYKFWIRSLFVQGAPISVLRRVYGIDRDAVGSHDSNSLSDNTPQFY